MDALEPEANRAQLIADLDLLLDWANSRARDRASGQGNLFDLMAGSADGDSDAPSDLSLAPKAAPVKDYHPSEKLKLEKDLVGFYLSDHPLKQLTPSGPTAGTDRACWSGGASGQGQGERHCHGERNASGDDAKG